MCFRDYEVVACGTLLIKPDITHVRAKPDIFRADETYVPIKWDLSDLGEKVNYYISHPDEAKRIAHAGRRCLMRYFEQGEFIDHFKDCLDLAL